MDRVVATADLMQKPGVKTGLKIVVSMKKAGKTSGTLASPCFAGFFLVCVLSSVLAFVVSFHFASSWFMYKFASALRSTIFPLSGIGIGMKQVRSSILDATWAKVLIWIESRVSLLGLGCTTGMFHSSNVLERII